MKAEHNLINLSTYINLSKNQRFSRIDSARHSLENMNKVFSLIDKDYQKQLKTSPYYDFPQVMLVTKYHPMSTVFPFILLGFNTLGENYVEGINLKSKLCLILSKIFTNHDSFTQFFKVLEEVKSFGIFTSTYDQTSIQALISELNLDDLFYKKVLSEEVLDQNYINLVLIKLIKDQYLTTFSFSNQILDFVNSYFDRYSLLQLSNSDSNLDLDITSSEFILTMINLINELTFLTDYKDFLESEYYLAELKHIFSNINYHLIGHLQSRKVKNIINYNYSIDTLDSIKLAKKLNKSREQLINNLNLQDFSQKLPVKIQLLSPNRNQEQDFGCSLAELDQLVETIIKECPYLEIQGLMFVASIENLEAEYKFAYEQIELLRQKLNNPNLQLSMGMTDSIDVSLKYQTNQLRIGSALLK